MQIPENEVGLPLVEAVKKETGRQHQLSTPLRWSLKKNRFGIRMESWLEGGRRVTSVEAVRRYFQANTDAANAREGIPASTPAQISKAHQQAVADLEREYA